MRPHPVAALARAGLTLTAALTAACYASHERAPASGHDDAGTRDAARFDAAGVDAALVPDAGLVPDAAAVCADLPGGDECGCVASYRRCDTCDLPCPDRQLCWRRFGVCRPPDALTPEGAPLHDTCGVDFGTPWGAYCPGGGPCALTPEVSSSGYGTGLCLAEAYCFAAPSADPPLPQSVTCVGSTGLPWRSPPRADSCPDPRLCGGPCGACPRDGLGAQACVGIDADRPFGVCARLAALCRTASPDSDPDLRGLDCLIIEPRADDVGWLTEPEPCRAYAERYPGVRCLAPRHSR